MCVLESASMGGSNIEDYAIHNLLISHDYKFVYLQVQPQILSQPASIVACLNSTEEPCPLSCSRTASSHTCTSPCLTDAILDDYFLFTHVSDPTQRFYVAVASSFRGACSTVQTTVMNLVRQKLSGKRIATAALDTQAKALSSPVQVGGVVGMLNFDFIGWTEQAELSWASLLSHMQRRSGLPLPASHLPACNDLHQQKRAPHKPHCIRQAPQNDAVIKQIYAQHMACFGSAPRKHAPDRAALALKRKGTQASEDKREAARNATAGPEVEAQALPVGERAWNDTAEREGALRIAFYNQQLSWFWAGPKNPKGALGWLRTAEQCAQPPGRPRCLFSWYEASRHPPPDAAVILAGRPDRCTKAVEFLQSLRARKRPPQIGLLVNEKDHYLNLSAGYAGFDLRVWYGRTAPMGKNCEYIGYVMDRRRGGMQPKATASRRRKVAGFVSNCGAQVRNAYITGLMRHVRVDQYGKCFKNMAAAPALGREGEWMQCKVKKLREFQFALAFENDDQQDYVTEKVFNAFMAGAIPIYLGTTDVFDYVPPHSIIHVKDYPEPAALAGHLEQVSRNRTLLEAYLHWDLGAWELRWRKLACDTHWVCRTCSHVAAAHPPARR